MKKRGRSEGDIEKTPFQYAEDSKVTDREQKFTERFTRKFTERFTRKFTEKLKVTEGRASKLLKILYFIENGDFSRSSFAETEGTSLRTVQTDINFLKDEGFICYEGATKAGKYKVTEKYKKLLQPSSKARE